MSNNPMSSQDAVAQEDIGRVLEMASEPSYISEIARKLLKADPAWDGEIVTGVEKVSIIISMLEERDDVDIYSVGYDNEDMGQKWSSAKFSLVPNDEEEGPVWNPYTLVHYNSSPDIREEYQEHVDQSVTVDEKISLIEELSNSGNKVSKEAELIMQDVMERQFRHYDETQTPSYNHPGVDFYVNDEDQRDWGLCIEVTTRYVNPVDKPYLDSKKEEAFDRDADLVILGPKFTDEMMDEYEDPDQPGWNDDPLGDVVHLHRVPPDEPTVYYPFAKKPDQIKEGDDEGNPIIIADSGRVQDYLADNGNVGDDYPVVDSQYDDMLTALGRVGRDFTVITESQYRNSLREAIEPLLWEFYRPYKIEQFLVETYWESGLTQKQVGRLVDRSGGTIRKWMMRNGVMRRGTGAPELSDDTIEIWSRMYNGEDPFEDEYSGYRIQAEYNRHPLWTLDDWEEWIQNTTEEERKEVLSTQDSHSDTIGYTMLYGPEDRLQPSYTFIMDTLREEGVEIREPDSAPRVPYNAYPSKKALEYMLNVNEDTIVDVSDEEN